MLEYQTLTITYHDNVAEQVKISRHAITDGVLHLFLQTGSYTDEEHAGSWPLTSIKKWLRTHS